MHAACSRFGISLAAIALTGLTGCSDRNDEARAQPSPSAHVLGVEPAPPSGETSLTTPVAAGTTEVSKPVEVGAMPLPGQPNDHSNVAILPSQRAETAVVLKDLDAAKVANADPSELPPEKRAKLKNVIKEPSR